MILDFKMKKIIEELKEKYNYTEANDCVVIDNDENMAQLIYTDSGIMNVNHPTFSVMSDNESDQKVILTFFVNPFNYHEWAYHRMGELIRYFYTQNKERNLILQSIDYTDLIIVFREDNVLKHFKLNLFKGLVEEYIH